MTTQQLTCPEQLFAPRMDRDREVARPELTARVQTLWARFSSCFESYDDYFAEMERSLPMQVRERRRERRQADRLLLIAVLSR